MSSVATLLSQLAAEPAYAPTWSAPGSVTNEPDQTNLPSGTTLVPGNTGGGQNTPFTAVNGAIYQSNASVGVPFGVNNYYVTAVASGNASSLRCSYGTPFGTFAVRGYFYFTGFGGGGFRVIDVTPGINFLSMTTNGNITVSANGTQVGISSNPLATNTWYRLEMAITTAASGATVTAAYYLGNSTTPVEVMVNTTAGNTGTTLSYGPTFGKVSTSSSVPDFRMTGLAWSFQSTLIGPVNTSGQTVRTWSPPNSDYGSNTPFYVSNLGSGAYLTIPPYATAVISFATYNGDAITPAPTITDSVTWTLISNTGSVAAVGSGSTLWVWAFKNQGSTAITVNPRVNDSFSTTNNHTIDIRGIIFTGAADPARVLWPASGTPTRTTDLSASITPTYVGSRLLVAFGEHGNGVNPPVRAATNGSTYSTSTRDGASIAANTNGERQTAGFYWRTGDEYSVGSPVTVGSTVALTNGDDAAVIGIEVPPESQEPLTNWLASAASQISSSSAAVTFTVPAGVPAGSVAVFWNGTNSGEFDTGLKPSVVATCSRSGVAITDLFLPFGENNTSMAGKMLVGIQSGDTITIDPDASGTSGVNGAYFDGPVRVGLMPGSRRQRRGTSSVAVVAPSIIVPAGTKVWALGMTRQNGSGTTFASASNSNGRALTSRLSSYYAATDPAINTNLLEFTEPTTSTGSTTINDTASSGNGVGMHLYSPGTQANVSPLPVVDPFSQSDGVKPDPIKWKAPLATSGSTALAKSSQLDLKLSAVGSYSDNLYLPANVAPVANVAFAYDFTMVSSSEAYFATFLRSATLNPSNASSAYKFQVDSFGDFEIDGPGGTIASTAVTITAGVQYHIAGQVYGNVLSFWIWTGSTQPTTPTIQGTDSSLTGPGNVVLALLGGNSATSDEVMLDNWSLKPSSAPVGPTGPQGSFFMHHMAA